VRLYALLRKRIYQAKDPKEHESQLWWIIHEVMNSEAPCLGRAVDSRR